MHQESLLGPVTFIIHIDDLSLLCNILKYVDDTTKLSEIIASRSSVSNMQSLLNQFSTWTDENNMQINYKNQGDAPRLHLQQRLAITDNSRHTPGKRFYLKTLGGFHFYRPSLGNTH